MPRSSPLSPSATDAIRQGWFHFDVAQFRLTPADWDRVLSVTGASLLRDGTLLDPRHPFVSMYPDQEWPLEPMLYGLPMVVDPDAEPLTWDGVPLL